MKSVIEEIGSYEDMVYVIKIHENGHRCGYVLVDDEKKFEKYRLEYAEHLYIPELKVHGGITFIDKIPVGDEFLPPGNWLGFDASHAGDLADFESAKKYFNESDVSRYKMFDIFGKEDGFVRTKEYMITECKYLIGQILKGE